jgi:hypothetical protein
MAYDDTTLKRDGSGITPVPQHFNPIADDYEPIYGRNNAGRVELYGPDGNPISTDDSNKLAVRATEIESLLNDIKGKDFATQTTVAAILNKIISAPATEAKQDALAALIGEVDADPTANTLLARIKSLEDKIDAIIDGSAPAVTQLSGSNTTVLADYTEQNQLITTTQVGFGAMAQTGSTNTYIPIDIRKYKNKLVTVRNLYDVSVKISIVGTKSITADSWPHISTFILYDYVLAAGASKTWYTDLINLNAPYQGLIVYAYASPLATTGTMEVLVLGGVN